jgi:O-antigen/teichoic acid export membrane protein
MAQLTNAVNAGAAVAEAPVAPATLARARGFLAHDDLLQTRAMLAMTPVALRREAAPPGGRRHTPRGGPRGAAAALASWLRLRAIGNRAIVGNASSLLASTVITSALGVAYWWLAAREFSPEAVGLAATSVSTMMLLATIASLGLGTLLIGEIPRRRGDAPALLVTAIVPAAIVGGGLGLVFAWAAPMLSADLAPLAEGPGSVALFALGASLTTIALVVDQACIGLLRGDLQLGRNGLFAVTKLGLLALASVRPGGSGLLIFATWVVGSLLSLAGLAVLVLRRWERTGAYWPQWSLLRGLSGAALAHHALNLALQAPQLILPALVTVLLSASTSAYFYAAWMVANLLFMAPIALTTALYAAAAGAPGALASSLRFSLGLAALGGVAGAGFLWFLAGSVLGVFGGAYASEAADALRILGLAVFPLIIRDHYVAVCRVQGRIGPAVLHVAVGGALAVTLAAIGAGIAGLPGLAAGYVMATGFQAIGMIPAVCRAARPVERRPVGQG